MNFKLIGFFAATGLATSSFSAAILYNSAAPAGNAATEAAWLAGVGITSPEFFVDFESFLNGINIHGDPGILPGGLTMTTANGQLLVSDDPADFGGSNPIDVQGLTVSENGITTMTFSTPALYVAGFDIDLNSTDIVVTFADSTTQNFTLEGTGSSGNSAEFWGIDANDQPGIVSITLDFNGGDSEAGLDNLQYGVVPEPATLVVLGIGALALARRKRKS